MQSPARGIRTLVSFMYIPCRTLAGEAELAHARLNLSRVQRHMLALVDGESSLDRLLQDAAFDGLGSHHLSDLIARELVALQPTAALARWDAVPVDAHSVRTPEERQQARRHHASQRAMRVHTVRMRAPDVCSAPRRAVPCRMPADRLAGSHRGTGPGAPDHKLDEARQLVTLALQRVAPLRGVLTRMRVHRARDRQALRALLPAVRRNLSSESGWPPLWPLMRRVEQLLAM
ncbi:MAG: hypothetical protein RL375_4385 [Pseudomonadota bacterium]